MADENATFHFVAGNLKKIAGVPRYALGALRAALTRRDPKLWVVGSAFGVADGALAVAQASQRLGSPPRIVWMAKDAAERREAVAAGFEAVVRDGREGYDATLHAGAVIVTHGLGDANRYAEHGAVIVHLGHGQPVKNTFLDSPTVTDLGPLSRLPGVTRAMRWMYRQGTKQITLFPAASEVFVPSLRSGYGLSDQVRVLGDPRSDCLFGGIPDELHAQSRAQILGAIDPRAPHPTPPDSSTPSDGPAHQRSTATSSVVRRSADGATAVQSKTDPAPRGQAASPPDQQMTRPRLIMYAPTWRDGDPDPGVPTPAEWQAIDEVCRRLDALLIIRPHPLGVGAYRSYGERVRLLADGEAMPLLWGLDALITDYSSMVVDFVATGAPLLLFAPDRQQYEAKRGLYLDLDELADGHLCESWYDVLVRLEALFTDESAMTVAQAHSEALRTRFHYFTDGHSADRVAAATQQLVRERLESATRR